MTNKNSSSSMPFRLLFLVLLANLVMLLAPTVNSAHLPEKKHEKCAVYKPAESEAGHRVKRVAGGADGDIRSMPWMVYLNVKYTSVDGHRTLEGGCTGSLVSRRHVLTALHCVPFSRMPNSSYTITARFGSANKSAPITAISVTTASVYKNPQASQYSVNNSASQTGRMSINVHDTALIDLGQDLHLDETIQPICVACLDNQTFPQGEAYIAGWGNIDPVCNNGAGTWPNVFKYERVGLHKCLTQPWIGADKVCTDADSTHGIGGVDSGSALLASANDGRTFLQVGVIGTTNCLPTQREDGSSKVDKQWFEQVTGVKCKKFRVNSNNNDSDCEDED